MRRLLLLCGISLLPLALLILSGCSEGSMGSSGANQVGGVSNPPIHVNLTRAGVSYTPAQIRHAYGFDQLAGNGAGQSIAIVDAYGSPTIQSDLNTFSAQFGLPATTITIVYPTGKPSKIDAGWALETALDVEWAHAIAPGATILLVVARSNYNRDLLPAVDYAAQHARQVSMSWGGSESSGSSSLDSHFNVAGVSFFASSGDNGSGIEWPAVSQYVVGVGGTSLYLDGSNNRTSETAWSGSGGGQSRYISEPSFQTAWQTSGKRQVPDVSYDANPNTGFRVYDGTLYSGRKGWWVVGGTSAGAPQWAALMALVNAGRATSIASATTALYSVGNPSNYLTNFVDVTSGSNGGYSATTGYDMVTGIGVPQAQALVLNLTSY